MIRIGVIGAGRWGPNYVRNFTDLEGVQMVAVADPRDQALQEVGRRFPDLALVNDYRELIADPEINAIVVATPASTHHEIGLACLQAGKHVLIEKPLADSSRQALELAQYPLAPGQIFMVGHIFRFHPGINKMREVMYDGTLGPVRYVNCVRTNLGPVRKDVSVIWDLAPHDVSIALHLFNGMPLQVSATMGHYLQGSKGDVAFINLLFPQGELFNILVSWVDPQKRREVEVIGTNALVRFDDMNLGEPVRIIQRSLREVPSYTTFGEFQLVTHASGGIIPYIEPKEPLKEQCLEFVRSIKTGHQPLSDVRDGYRICVILEAAEQSAAAGGAPVKVEAEA
ncbi:MAG: Gfo/Idh/MocA family oxidoreductase [Armatimonadia bacterium]